MYDLAREQAPTLDHLRLFAKFTQDAGYDALGLYLEHRFAYPSTPWSHGLGCVTPDMVRTLEAEFPAVQIIPFINLLGHFEGMIYTEEGKRFREELFSGLQACPSCPEFVSLCEKLIDDTCDAFKSPIVHIGGDETNQLGACERCKARVEAAEAQGKDGKAEIYGEHFAPLAQRVLDRGRVPAVWGDMFLTHPTALPKIPKETLIFDWQYGNGVRESSELFSTNGFKVIGCPAIKTYSATWLHLEESEENVREVSRDVRDLGLEGVCVTTWECGLFGAYDTLFPALEHSATIVRDPGCGTCFLDAYGKVSAEHRHWAQLMGIELKECGGPFAYSGIRSSLKVRLLLNANPFLAWMHHGEHLCGPGGDLAMEIVERALQIAPTEAEMGVSLFARAGIEFVRLAEVARQAYADGRTGIAISALSPARTLFDDLAKVAKASHSRIGGSLADIERCKAAKAHVERVITRIRDYGDRSLGYLPAWEHLTHHKFMPHDQAAWWLINKWANQ